MMGAGRRRVKARGVPADGVRGVHRSGGQVGRDTAGRVGDDGPSVHYMITRVKGDPGGRPDRGEGEQVFGFVADVFSSGGNVFSFRPDVFSLG